MTLTVGLVGALAAGALGLLKLAWEMANRRPERVDRAVLAGELLVIADARSELSGTYVTRTYVHRGLGARRLDDGGEVARITETAHSHTEGTRFHAWDDALHLLGASGGVLWCSSGELPVHRRRPATLEVIEDGRRLPPLKPIDGNDDPLFDPTTGRVHAYTLDGRGIAIAPDFEIVEAPRPRASEDSSRVRMVDEVTLPGGARVWLTGRDERKLHGLAQPAKFHEGRILVTDDHHGPPLLVLHRAPLADGGAEQLTAIGAAPLWTTTFRRPTVERARHLFVAGGRLLLVVAEPCEALALDAASGALLWRVRL